MRFPFFLSSSLVWLLFSSCCFAQNEATTNTTTTTTNNTNVTNGGEDDLTWEEKVYLNFKYQEGWGKVIEGQYIIQLSNNVTVVNETIDALVNSSGMDRETVLNYYDKAYIGFLWQAKSDEEKWEILAKLLESDLVELIEEDQEVHAWNENENAADTVCPRSWGLDRVDQSSLPLDHIYHYDWTGESVDIYILDTGVRESHEQFEGRATCAFSVIRGEPCTDGNGHGTHCSATAGGRDFGVAKKANIISIKVLNNMGAGSNSGILIGIDFVVRRAEQTGRKSIISLSLGGAGMSKAMDFAIQNAFNSGVLVVAAAGNENTNACFFQPANSQYSLTVGSTDINDVRSSFSNFGSCVQVFAPGSDITSAWWDSDTATNTISGTSMATPLVAGIAALYWDQDPSLSIMGLMGKLLQTSTVAAVTDASGPDDGIALTIATHTTAINASGTHCSGYFSAAPVGVFSSSSLVVVMSISTVACYFVSMLL